MTAQPGPRAPRVVTVKRLADFIKAQLEGHAALKNVSVRGELSGVFRHANGGLSFSLKDRDALVQCYASAYSAADFPARLENGAAVVATGGITTYAQKSTYQLVVRAIALEGVGNLQAIFEERKRMLAAEGLFATERKRKLPRFPFRVALVSSRAANGAQDFCKLLSDRAPHVEIVWFETLVQGPNAPPEIARALARASRADVDCIVLTRGGGAFEDLFCFSDERVVRAVANVARPIVSAIGHTADQQLCDFAADAHVETPSAAAEAIGYATSDLRASIEARSARVRAAVELRIERYDVRLGRALVRSKVTDPRLFLAPLAQRVGDLDAALARTAISVARARERRVRDLERRLDRFHPRTRLDGRAHRLQVAARALDLAGTATMERARARFRIVDARLEAAARGIGARLAQSFAIARAQLGSNDPEAILQRGYAIVTQNDAIVRDPAALAPGSTIAARVARGTIFARVESEGGHGN